MPKVSFAHLTGSPFSRHAALALWEGGMLAEVVTTLPFREGTRLDRALKLVPGSPGRKLRSLHGRRLWPLPPEAPMRGCPLVEAKRLLSSRWQGSKRPMNRAVVELDRLAAERLDGLDACYAYEDNCAITFEAARERGVKRFLDQPIMRHEASRRLHAEEAELFPELKPFLFAADEPAWRLERKDRELELADHVFAASTATLESLREAGVPNAKISVIPYGVELDLFRPAPKPDGKFRCVFAGLVGPRKGAHYLLDAWKRLALPPEEAELLLVGRWHLPQAWRANLPEGVRHVPGVPRNELPALFASADAFVFPSLVEGFGMVLLEAMACGLPGIATPNTAAPDIASEGEDGFVVPIRDADALAEKILWCRDNPDALAQMKLAARRKAEAFTWKAYREKFASRIRELLEA